MRVTWLARPDDASLTDFEALATGVPEILLEPVADVPGDADVLIVDTRSLAIDELGRALRGFGGIALVRCAKGELSQVLAILRSSDEVSLRDEPLELFLHRLRAACKRAFPDRDSLTGLFTRSRVLEEVDNLVAQASSESPAAAVLFDIDHLKRINDSHGHMFGDQLLQDLALRIRRLAPRGTTSARIGGDEFLVVGALARDRALALAEAVLADARRQPFGEVSFTLSAGFSVVGYSAGAAHELLREADSALYAAKARGRDRIIDYDDLRRESGEADRDVALELFEASTRTLTEKAAEAIAARGRRLFRQLREQADVDALTGLFTRRYMDRRLAFDVDEAGRTQSSIAVALLDLDSFGLINKRYGWPTGDRVLTDVAERIRRNVRPSDWVARYGGEEICVVMMGTGQDQATPVLERLRSAIAEQPFETTGGQPLAVTISVGAAVRETPIESMASLVERASEKLLAAKRSGKNRVAI